MDASPLEVEVRGELEKQWSLRADGIKVPKVEGFNLHRQPEGPT
jgi:hypothetical protein